MHKYFLIRSCIHITPKNLHEVSDLITQSSYSSICSLIFDAVTLFAHSNYKTLSKMKHIIILACLFFSLNVTAQTGQDCENKSKQIKPSTRHEFLKSCLEQVSLPANVHAVAQQKKQETCAQNEKNMKHDGVTKPNYISECMNRNDAATAAQKAARNRPANTAPITHHAQVAIKKSDGPAREQATTNNKKSCAQQAQLKKLKGKERKQFIGDCTQQ
ncbi:MAG: hypothetical protein RL358_627 [Pseudomonadota bacterium]